MDLFNHYWQVARIRQTGRPTAVQVIAKRRVGGRQPNQVTVLVNKRVVVLQTRDKQFFRSNGIRQMTMVMKRDDSALLVPPHEPTTGFLVICVLSWGLVATLVYVVLHWN